MANPVIVFVNPSKLGLDRKLFPVGFSNNGRHQPVQEDSEYDVLLVDDTSKQIESNHRNKDEKTVIPIIGHNTSEHHKNPAQSIPTTWGKSIVCEWFSHVDDDLVFIEIKKLVANSITPEKFAERNSKKMRLEQLDKLAAISQIHIISQHFENQPDTESYEKTIFGFFGPHFEDDFDSWLLHEDKSGCNWNYVLQRLRTEATKLI